MTPAVRPCPECGTPLAGASAVEGLCSACLLSAALRESESPRPALEAAGAERATPRARELRPAQAGVVAPTWAMPAELLRQASHRLRLAGVGIILFFAGSILLNSLVDVAG